MCVSVLHALSSNRHLAAAAVSSWTRLVVREPRCRGCSCVGCGVRWCRGPRVVVAQYAIGGRLLGEAPHTPAIVVLTYLHAYSVTVAHESEQVVQVVSNAGSRTDGAIIRLNVLSCVAKPAASGLPLDTEACVYCTVHDPAPSPRGTGHRSAMSPARIPYPGIQQSRHVFQPPSWHHPAPYSSLVLLSPTCLPGLPARLLTVEHCKRQST